MAKETIIPAIKIPRCLEIEQSPWRLELKNIHLGAHFNGLGHIYYDLEVRRYKPGKKFVEWNNLYCRGNTDIMHYLEIMKKKSTWSEKDLLDLNFLKEMAESLQPKLNKLEEALRN